MAAGFSFCIRSSGIVVVDCAPCCPVADSSVSHGAFLQACVCGITLLFFSKGPSDPCGFVASLPNHVVLVADPCGFIIRPWFHCPTLCCHCPTLVVLLPSSSGLRARRSRLESHEPRDSAPRELEHLLHPLSCLFMGRPRWLQPRILRRRGGGMVFNSPVLGRSIAGVMD